MPLQTQMFSLVFRHIIVQLPHTSGTTASGVNASLVAHPLVLLRTKLGITKLFLSIPVKVA